MKRLLILLVLALSILSGCNTKTENFISENNSEKSIDVVEEIEVQKEETIPIQPDSLVADISILEPDSIGMVYMEATYTNNSEYAITGYDATVLLKDKNEKTYLSTYDTVLPGETSPKFTCFGPATRDYNDYEILKLSVTAKTDTGSLYIDYDFKLKEASWWEAND